MFQLNLSSRGVVGGEVDKLKTLPPGPMSTTRMCIQIRNTRAHAHAGLGHAIMSEVKDCFEIEEEERSTQTDAIK